MSPLESDPWGESPFYRADIDPLSPLPQKQAAAAPAVDQKTLEEWHHRITELIIDLRGDTDAQGAIRDLEDLDNELQTYLRG